ncbi:hypothetical protein CFOL_v3_25952 [Cephalotus follicularis]|uniref:Uncharacterized protein n=1 Tax=Cephalotus follicularis TaxID=3775 RepID=A0A1Q3CQX9_CEPFO|nr:hypothetical protein CFOL_v3_25952 [Cephalotus follicularis]
MDRNGETTSSFQPRGVGGKLKKPPPSTRRQQSTPYARPQRSQSSRWLVSKLLHPAYRLISGGANKILPSLFSTNSPSFDSMNHEEDDIDKLNTHVEQKASGDDENCVLDVSLFFSFRSSIGVAGPSRTADILKHDSEFDGHKQGQKDYLTDEDGFSEIEQLVKGKSFSRDEINHLMEIIQSRAATCPDVEQENKDLSVIAGRDAERTAISFENPSKPVEEKQEDLNIPFWGTSTPFRQSSVKDGYMKIKKKQSSFFILVQKTLCHGYTFPTAENGRVVHISYILHLALVIHWTSGDEVGASPIEIARAYMGTRTSERRLDSNSIIFKDERVSLQGSDGFASKPFFPSPSPKPSTCWPGAMVQDQRGQRGKFGLQYFPRTPYSRAIYSKSKSELQGDSSSCLNKSITPLPQVRTPIIGQVSFIFAAPTLEDGHGSVGPTRRLRHKVNAETPPRGSVYSNFSFKVPHLENLNVSEHFFPAAKKNLELGGTSSLSTYQPVEDMSQGSEVRFSTFRPHSSQMARTILDHLERNPPTPKDKSAELKLAISWQKPQSSDGSTFKPHEHNSLPLLGGVDSAKKLDQVDKKNFSQLNGDRGNFFFNLPPWGSAIEANGAVDKANSASDDVLKIAQNTGSEVPNVQKKPPSHSSGNKPVLPLISIAKPVKSWASSDNSSGFSFPISSSGVLSEPPTPSVLPSSVNCGPKEVPAIPSFSFGSKSSTPALVFSFPSTSSCPINDDVSDIEFNFGSEKTTRISFSSFGEDSICY